MDLFTQYLEHDLVIELIETPSDVTLDKPGRSRPIDRHLRQCGVTATAGTETVRAIGKLRLVIRLQKQADHFADEFIRPGGLFISLREKVQCDYRFQGRGEFVDWRAVAAAFLAEHAPGLQVSDGSLDRGPDSVRVRY